MKWRFLLYAAVAAALIAWGGACSERSSKGNAHPALRSLSFAIVVKNTDVFDWPVTVWTLTHDPRLGTAWYNLPPARVVARETVHAGSEIVVAVPGIPDRLGVVQGDPTQPGGVTEHTRYKGSDYATKDPKKPRLSITVEIGP